MKTPGYPMIIQAMVSTDGNLFISESLNEWPSSLQLHMSILISMGHLHTQNYPLTCFQ